MFKFKYTRDGVNFIEHELPAPLPFTFDAEKIAKAGTSRNAQTGEMFLNYIGIAEKITLKWDLLPNTKAFTNLYRILEALPDFFFFIFPHPNGEGAYELECYNNLWSVNAFLFTANDKFYRGLSTTFVSKNLKTIPSTEPVLVP